MFPFVTSCHFGVPSASGPHRPLLNVTKAGPCALPGGTADGAHHAHGDWIGYGTADGSPVRRESVIATATSARSFRPSRRHRNHLPNIGRLEPAESPMGFGTFEVRRWETAPVVAPATGLFPSHRRCHRDVRLTAAIDPWFHVQRLVAALVPNPADEWTLESERTALNQDQDQQSNPEQDHGQDKLAPQ